MPHRWVVAVLAAATALAAAPNLAGADDDAFVPPAAYGVASLELSGIGYLALRFGTDVIPDDGAGALAANLAPALIGAGAAHAAYRYDLDPQPALAAHGAVWLGADC